MPSYCMQTKMMVPFIPEGESYVAYKTLTMRESIRKKKKIQFTDYQLDLLFSSRFYFFTFEFRTNRNSNELIYDNFSLTFSI